MAFRHLTGPAGHPRKWQDASFMAAAPRIGVHFIRPAASVMTVAESRFAKPIFAGNDLAGLSDAEVELDWFSITCQERRASISAHFHGVPAPRRSPGPTWARTRNA